MEISSLRHPKENLYRIISFIPTVLLLPLIIITGPLLILYVLVFALFGWLAQQWAMAYVMGHCVQLSDKQFPELNKIAQDVAKELRLKEIPAVFIMESSEVNAFALRFVHKRYVFLTGMVMDIMLAAGRYDEIRFIIGHEFAHHALGHTSPWLNLAILPAQFIPFLGGAYSRACELSADRVAFVLGNYSMDAVHALANLATGSRHLASRVDLDVFAAQEYKVPAFFGFLTNLYATHPRLTVRILELKSFTPQSSFGSYQQQAQAAAAVVPTGAVPPALPSFDGATYQEVKFGNACYRGEMLDGKCHGKGRMEWDNGTVYEGEFQNDKMHGLGRMTWSNGAKQEGRFADGSYVGPGGN